MDKHLQRPVSPQLKQTLKNFVIVGGIFWTVAYVLMIQRGFTDHTNAMPGLALCCNFAWEIVFSFRYIPPSKTQWRINLLWCLLDSILFVQFLKYGHGYFLASQSLWVFYLCSIILLLVCIYYVVNISQVCNDTVIGRYTALGGNVLMSALFIMMLQQKGILGQSLTIAFSKMFGTAMFGYAFYKGMPKDRLSHLMSITSVVLDIVYVVMLVKEASINF